MPRNYIILRNEEITIFVEFKNFYFFFVLELKIDLTRSLIDGHSAYKNVKVIWKNLALLQNMKFSIFSVKYVYLYCAYI